MTQMTDEKKAFQDAVERLYTVFSKYPLRPDTEPCPCCHNPEDELRLHRKPLAELEADDLYHYAWSALWTWGTDEDFKHFLPRLFQLVAEEVIFRFVDIPVLFKKLNVADWREWPADEQESIENYFIALWRYLLVSPEIDVDIDDILCGIAHPIDDLTPYLEMWRKSGRAGHYLLADFIRMQYGDLVNKRKLFNTFWQDDSAPENDRTAQMNQVIDWILDPATKATLEEAFFIEASASDGNAEELSTAVGILEHLAKIYPKGSCDEQR